ncbi:MAG: hypothetical protein J5565_04165 [Muribaculaceae bacterium]|nr:hypothetical protein [Muribaculaceae bacterium]
MKKYLDWIQLLGLVIMMVMAVLPLLNVNEQWMRWCYAAGAAIVLLARLFTTYHGDNLRVRRLYRINIVSAVLYCASAAMLFWGRGTADWIAFLLAGAVLQMYATMMIDRETKKTHSTKSTDQ